MECSSSDIHGYVQRRRRDGPCDSRSRLSHPSFLPTSHFPLHDPISHNKPLGTHPKLHPLTSLPFPSLPSSPTIPINPHSTTNITHQKSRQLSEQPPLCPSPIQPRRNLCPILKHRPSVSSPSFPPLPTSTTEPPTPIPRTGSDRAEMSAPHRVSVAAVMGVSPFAGRSAAAHMQAIVAAASVVLCSLGWATFTRFPLPSTVRSIGRRWGCGRCRWKDHPNRVLAVLLTVQVQPRVRAIWKALHGCKQGGVWSGMRF